MATTGLPAAAVHDLSNGTVSECTGENVFIVRDGVILTPNTSDAGALDGITQDSVETIAGDLGYEVRHQSIIRTDLYLADEAFLTGTAAEVVPICAVDDRPVGPGHPGRITKEIQQTYFATVRGEVDQYEIVTMSTDDAGAGIAAHRHGDVRHTHAHDFSVPDLPEAVDIFDTILRDGSQQEGLSLTVDDKLRVAEQLDHLGVTYIEGGWPGANPKDVEFFARAKKGIDARHGHAGRIRLHPHQGVKPQDDAVLANLTGRAPVACIVAKTWDRHVDEVRIVLRSTRPWRWWPTRSSYLRHTTSASSSMPSTSSTATAATPTFALSVLVAAEEAGAEALVFATPTGAHCPTTSGGGRRRAARHCKGQLGIHCRDDAGCAVANSMVAVQAGATQVPGCINGYGERAGNTAPVGGHPQPFTQAEHPHHPQPSAWSG